jgi:hypothetical protein
MRTIDPVLAESSEVLKLWTSAFSTKCGVMVVVICRLRVEGRRAKGRIGCLRDKKVLRKDLTTVSSRGHLGRWFEGSACAGCDFVSAKDNRTLLFSKNGDMISMNKKKERDM